MRFNPYRTIKYYTLKFMRLRGTPRSLAMGTAIGIFIGISPTMPLHTITIIGLTLLMRSSTIAALISATIVSNPLTFVPQYYLCWWVGNFLLPGRLNWERIEAVLKVLTHSGFMESLKSLSLLSTDAIAVMLTGGIVIGLPLAAICYFSALRFFTRLQEKKRSRHILH